jgi:hypothetical protein
MSMSKKDFIALADAIKEHNRVYGAPGPAEQDVALFDSEHLHTLATFCRQQNGNFMRDRWLGYIAGTCGQNGGSK